MVRFDRQKLVNCKSPTYHKIHMANTLVLTFKKIVLIVWKNLILRKRHWAVTVCETILPSVFVLLVLLLTGQFGRPSKESTRFDYYTPTLSYMSLVEGALSELNGSVVAYAPGNNFTNAVVLQIASIADNSSSPAITWLAFQNEPEIEKAAKNQLNTDDSSHISAAIVFQDGFNTARMSGPYNGTFSYKIRLGNDNPEEFDEIDTSTLIAPQNSQSGLWERTPYEQRFLGLQILIENVLMNMLTNDKLDIQYKTMSLKKTPNRVNYYEERGLKTLLPIMLSIGLLFIVPSVIREVVSEKESGIKELMRMMGLPNWMHLLGWMIDSTLFLIITTSLIIFLLFTPFDGIGGIIKYGSGLLWWVVLWLCCTQTVAMCIFIASLFQNPASAITVAVTLWVTTIGIAYQLQHYYASYNDWARCSLCGIPTISLFMSLMILLEFENISNGKGAQWENLYQSMYFYKDDWLSLGIIMAMMVVSTVVYLCLAVYLENVLPSKFGVQRPWYYPFQTCSKRTSKFKEVNKTDSLPEYFEPDPTDCPAGIQIVSLRKVFRNGNVVVDNLTLNIYHGQITALLGHNGAGKTTAMSIVTGVISPSSGTAFIVGHDVTKDLKSARQYLGFCPQHNMLFDRLTVYEHLKFFTKLNGVSMGSAAEAEISYITGKLHINDKLHQLSKNLSGGQKRKLNLAMALVGGSKVVILDEPTSGMDPESRHAMWDLLLEARLNRTIFLTTHMMEEADVLGDRIAIMANGKLICCGSPMFIKHQFGSGYILRFTLSEDSSPESILSLVQKYVSKAAIQDTKNPLELAIALGDLANHSVLPDMFDDLENRSDDIGIESVGLSATTMDEIFIKVASLDLQQAERTVNREPQIANQSLEVQKPQKNQAPTKNVQLKPSTTTAPVHSSSSKRIKEVTKSKLNQVNEDGSNSGTALNKVHASTDPQIPSVSLTSQDEGQQPVPQNTTPTKKLRDGILQLHQCYAILMKRIHYTRRKIIMVLVQVLIVLLLVIWSIISSNTFRTDIGDLPALKITTSSYTDPVFAFESDGQKLGEAFVNILGTSAINITGQNLRDYWVAKGTENFGEYRGTYIGGAELSYSRPIGYFSSAYIHTSPLIVNILSNTYLRDFTSLTAQEEITVEVTNHPLTTGTKLFEQALQTASNVNELQIKVYFPLVFASFMIVSLAVTAAFLVIFPVEERTSKLKQLQLMAGIEPCLFWLVSLLWDFIILLIISSLIICCFPIFQTKEIFTDHGAIGALYFILLVFSFSSICFAYFISLVVATPTVGFSLIVMINIYFGLGHAIFVPIFETFHMISFSLAYTWIGRISPFYGIAISLFRFGEVVARNNRCSLFPKDTMQELCRSSTTTTENGFSRTCCDCQPDELPQNGMNIRSCFHPSSYLVWSTGWAGGIHSQLRLPGITQELVYSFAVAVIYLVIVICNDYGLFKKSCSKIPEGRIGGGAPDTDVFTEVNRVRNEINTGTFTGAVAISGIVKYFRDFPAIVGLTFGVYTGECFGLLGVNGAGKTTTFRILTGDLTPTVGNAYMQNCTLRKGRKKFLSQIGYCPQYDAVLDVLTGKEILQLIARLRGIEQVNQEITKWLIRVGLQDSATVQVRKYSGGMKRRLSAAMAMIGDPPVLMLDEPTSGVDPLARHQFREIIRLGQASGQTIILTSHSMDECEALCSRLSIMVNGQLQCFGGIQHIKNKYAQGFTFTLKLKPNVQDVQYLMDEIVDKFQPCFLKDRHLNILQYQVLKDDLPWAQLFGFTEDIQMRYADVIEDYSVIETSLEDVFVTFARRQNPLPGKAGGCCSCSC